MLFRLSGKLSTGVPFTSRVEASDAINALGIGRRVLNENGVEDKDVAEMRARAATGGKSVTFGKVKDPNAPKRERKPKAKTAGK